MTDDLLDYLEELYKLSERQPGDVDAAQLAARLGITPDKARNKLKLEVKKGVLKAVRVRGPNNAPMWVYRRTGDDA